MLESPGEILKHGFHGPRLEILIELFWSVALGTDSFKTPQMCRNLETHSCSAVVLKCQGVSQSLGGLMKHRALVPKARVSDISCGEEPQKVL